MFHGIEAVLTIGQTGECLPAACGLCAEQVDQLAGILGQAIYFGAVAGGQYE